MKTELENELRKVELSTTLCHLCSLSQLEKWVVEARKQPKGQSDFPDL